MPYWDDSGRYLGQGISLPVVGSHKTNPFRRRDMDEGRAILIEFDRAISDEEVELVNETMRQYGKALGVGDKVYGLISTEEQVDEAQPKLSYSLVEISSNDVNIVSTQLPDDARIIFVLSNGTKIEIQHGDDHLSLTSDWGRLHIVPRASNAIFVRGAD